MCSYLDIVHALVSKELKKVAAVPLTHGKPMKVWISVQYTPKMSLKYLQLTL